MARELYTTSLLDLTTLKAYYRFSTGALTTDSSGEGHTLVEVSDPAEVDGVFGKAVEFDGTDAYQIADHADFKPTGVFSAGFWVKTSNAGVAEFLFQSYAYASSIFAGWGIYKNTDNKVYFFSGKNTGNVAGTDLETAVSTTTISDGNWHFIVGLWDSSYLDLYIDNIREAHVAWAYSPVYQATNYPRIACRNRTGADAIFLTGSMDDVFLFNGYVLTASNIRSLYTGVKKVAGVDRMVLKSVDAATEATLKKIVGIA